ncbi:3-phosphoshikimate 1-carboxyvinyltransferase [Paenibacillus sp. HJGM_3]
MTVPGSKSFTTRALLLAGLAQGRSSLRHILRSDDAYWCLEALAQLGTRVTFDADDPTAVVIEGAAGRWPRVGGTVYMGAAGTVARFLPGAIAACGRGEWRLTGSTRLSERPIAPLVDAWQALGARVQYADAASPGRLPLRIDAGALKGGEVTVSGAVSSQFISGLLLAAPYAEHETIVRVPDGIVQHAYVKMTLELMERFGVSVEYDEAQFDRFLIRPQRYQGCDLELEADASTCGYFLAYAALTGGAVRIPNLSDRTRQPDIGMLQIWERMGCTVKAGGESAGIEVQGPPVGKLRGGFTVSLREMSDQTLTLAAMAPFADAPITITDVAHIRAHECDRIQAMCESLARLGIRVEERSDGMTIHPGTPRPAVLPTYDDHRMSMSLALIGTRVEGIVLQDPGCVSKTCPTYWEMMQQLGLRVTARE